MKRERRTQAERSEEMRARLSLAAYEIIAERGHSAFRTAAVAARAGVSEGALLHHFSSKDAVTLAAIQQALTLAGNASRKRLARAKGPSDAVLQAMLADFRAFFLGDRFWVALDIAMDASKNAGIASKIRKIVAECRAPIYRSWGEKLMACGWHEVHAVNTVRTTAALISGFAIRSLWNRDVGASRKIEEDWLEFIRTRQ